MSINQAELVAHLTQETVYLMGISFMLGSLFTIFILLILDMMRVARTGSAEEEDPRYEAEYEQDADSDAA